MQSVILKTATHIKVGLMMVYAVYILLRGQHKTKGGFYAKLLEGTAFALFAITEGADQVRRAIRIRPAAIAMTGLALAVASGLPALFTGAPFLAGIWWHLNGFSVGTPLIFDMGVFLAVLGAILSILLALEEN